jgi:hypothetical protein
LLVRTQIKRLFVSLARSIKRNDAKLSAYRTLNVTTDIESGFSATPLLPEPPSAIEILQSARRWASIHE